MLKKKTLSREEGMSLRLIELIKNAGICAIVFSALNINQLIIDGDVLLFRHHSFGHKSAVR